MESEKFTIESIKRLIEKVVARYVANHAIPTREKSDVVMTVLEKFLNKRQKIDDAFEGKSKISTYYIAVFNRMCCEVIRKERKYWDTLHDNFTEDALEKETTSFYETEKQLLIKGELKRLGVVMQLFFEEEAKIYLFTRYYYRLLISMAHIKPYSEEYAEEIFRILNLHPAINQSEIFNNLAQVTALVEGKSVKGDAIRMWLNKRLDMLLDRINMNGVSRHNRDSLQILLELKE